MRIVIIFVYLFSCIATIWSKTSRCDRRPSINGICTSATVGIYYDQDTEKCKYQGCGNGKKLFESLEDCERVCNNRNRRNRRVQSNKNNANSTTAPVTPPLPTTTATLAPTTASTLSS